METIGNIYNKKTSEQYYETIGKNAENFKENDAEKLLDSLTPQDLRGKTVLDLGCGNGQYSEKFCENGAKKVVAIDLSEEMIEQTQTRKNEKKLEQLELIRTDMNNLPIKNNKFDFIFSRFSLVHTGNMEQVIKNLGKALSANGEILIATNIASVPKKEIQSKSSKEPIPVILTIGEKKVELQDFFYTIDEYTDALNKAGLKTEVVEQFPAEELSINPKFPSKDEIKFSYGVLKARKEKENRE